MAKKKKVEATPVKKAPAAKKDEPVLKFRTGPVDPDAREAYGLDPE